VTLISAAISCALIARDEPTGRDIAIAVVSGGMIGFVLISLEILLQGRAAATLRRLPVLLVLGLRTVLYGVVFVAGAHGATAMIDLVWGLSAPARAASLPNVNLLLSFCIALGINFAFMLRALLGPGTVIALLMGRYHQPQREERIVLFLDLHGSTQLAERLGDERFHRFLNRVFFDLADPVLDAGGEIYRYIGDEIIVTWKPRRDAQRAVSCAFAIEDTLARRRADYLEAFGVAPRLRAALHAGPLIIGEMGDVKREIVMLGDTMNTAARIEEVCRTTGRDYIASESVIRLAAPPPPGVRAESLGKMPLRGKESSIELFALSRT
jgi:adenylate cyclase